MNTRKWFNSLHGFLGDSVGRLTTGIRARGKGVEDVGRHVRVPELCRLVFLGHLVTFDQQLFQMQQAHHLEKFETQRINSNNE